jgi:hypothetical protein
MTTKCDVKFRRGEDWKIKAQLLDEDGVPLPMTDPFTVKVRINDENDTALLTLNLNDGVTVLDAQEGWVLIDVIDSKQDEVPLGCSTWAVQHGKDNVYSIPLAGAWEVVGDPFK